MQTLVFSHFIWTSFLFVCLCVYFSYCESSTIFWRTISDQQCLIPTSLEGLPMFVLLYSIVIFYLYCSYTSGILLLISRRATASVSLCFRPTWSLPVPRYLPFIYWFWVFIYQMFPSFFLSQSFAVSFSTSYTCIWEPGEEHENRSYEELKMLIFIFLSCLSLLDPPFSLLHSWTNACVEWGSWLIARGGCLCIRIAGVLFVFISLLL